MIDIRHLFDYYTKDYQIDHRRLVLAVTGINDLGPVPLLREDNKSLQFLTEDQFLNNFAIYSMLAAVQGSNYEDRVLLLPVADYPDYQALVIGLKNQKAQGAVHEQYMQIIVFIPTEQISFLPPIVIMEHEIIDIVRRSRIQDMTTAGQLLHLKFKILRFLNECI